MRTALLTCLLATAALAGCASAPEPEQPQDDPGVTQTTSQTTGTTPTTTTTTTTTSPAPAPQNTPPEATLHANVTNGTVPLNVTFTLNGTDADGDALAWSFDADGDGVAESNGTQLPAEVVHTYNVTGDHMATLTVHDGEDSASASVNVSVVMPPPEHWYMVFADASELGCGAASLEPMETASEGCVYGDWPALYVAAEAGVADATTFTFPGAAASRGHEAGTPIAATLSIDHGPYPDGTIRFALTADGVEVFATEIEMGGPVAEEGPTSFGFQGATSAAIPPGAVLEVSATLDVFSTRGGFSSGESKLMLG